MRINKRLTLLGYVLIIFFTFPFLFRNIPINGGDYVSPTATYLSYWENFAFTSWDTTYQLGWNVLPLIHFAPISVVMGFFGKLFGHNTPLIERVIWWLPYFMVGFFSIRALYTYCFGEKYAFLVPIFYMFNTYILMIIGGGQIAGIGLAYAFFPFVILQIIKLMEMLLSSATSPRTLGVQSVFTGLMLAIMLVLEIRVTFIVALVLSFIVMYYLATNFFKFKTPTIYNLILYVIIVPLAVVLTTHAYWILPTVLLKGAPIDQFGSTYTSVEMLKFLSFAKLENTISLLHPHWPENIFGKTYFFSPEFLFIPLMVFCFLLFPIKFKKRTKNIIQNEEIILKQQKLSYLFVVIAFIGIFLSKGTNEPLGVLYVWLYDNVPGFFMFRDATKWYVLTSVSYAMLLPLSLRFIIDFIVKKILLGERYKSVVTIGIVGLCAIAWLVTIREAYLGKLTGTFIARNVPDDYNAMNTFLEKDNDTYRLLWLPQQQRYGHISYKHPALSANIFYDTSNPVHLAKKIIDPNSIRTLQLSGVKFIVVPDDTFGEFFTSDRKYDEVQYQQVLSILESSQLGKKIEFGRNVLFEIPDYKEKLWVESERDSITWRMVSPTKYIVEAKNGTIDGRLIFSERFDSQWVARDSNGIVKSERYNDLFNSYTVKGNTIEISYTPQKWLEIGLLTSSVSLAFILFLFVTLRSGINTKI